MFDSSGLEMGICGGRSVKRRQHARAKTRCFGGATRQLRGSNVMRAWRGERVAAVLSDKECRVSCDVQR